MDMMLLVTGLTIASSVEGIIAPGQHTFPLIVTPNSFTAGSLRKGCSLLKLISSYSCFLYQNPGRRLNHTLLPPHHLRQHHRGPSIPVSPTPLSPRRTGTVFCRTHQKTTTRPDLTSRTPFQPHHYPLLPQGPGSTDGRPVSQLHLWHLWGAPHQKDSSTPQQRRTSTTCHLPTLWTVTYLFPTPIQLAPSPNAILSHRQTLLTSNTLHVPAHPQHQDKMSSIRFFPSSWMPITSTNRVHHSHTS